MFVVPEHHAVAHHPLHAQENEVIGGIGCDRNGLVGDAPDILLRRRFDIQGRFGGKSKESRDSARVTPWGWFCKIEARLGKNILATAVGQEDPEVGSPRSP